MIWKTTQTVGEGNLFYVYILKNVTKSQEEFYFGGGRIVGKGIWTTKGNRGWLKKTNKISRTFLVQWNHNGLVQGCWGLKNVMFLARLVLRSCTSGVSELPRAEGWISASSAHGWWGQILLQSSWLQLCWEKSPGSTDPSKGKPGSLLPQGQRGGNFTPEIKHQCLSHPPSQARGLNTSGMHSAPVPPPAGKEQLQASKFCPISGGSSASTLTTEMTFHWARSLKRKNFLHLRLLTAARLDLARLFS